MFRQKKKRPIPKTSTLLEPKNGFKHLITATAEFNLVSLNITFLQWVTSFLPRGKDEHVQNEAFMCEAVNAIKYLALAAYLYSYVNSIPTLLRCRRPALPVVDP